MFRHKSRIFLNQNVFCNEAEYSEDGFHCIHRNGKHITVTYLKPTYTDDVLLLDPKECFGAADCRVNILHILQVLAR